MLSKQKLLLRGIPAGAVRLDWQTRALNLSPTDPGERDTWQGLPSQPYQQAPLMMLVKHCAATASVQGMRMM